jgi:hypothetical protein
MEDSEVDASYNFESVDTLKTELRRCILTLIENNARVIKAQDDINEVMDKLQELAKKLE